MAFIFRTWLNVTFGAHYTATVALTVDICGYFLPSSDDASGATFLLLASRANTRDICSRSRIGRQCRETSSWHASRYKYSEPPSLRAALVYEGKCFVSANRLSPRSLPIPFYLLCHGSIFILRDNTVKAGRVLADFGSNSTLNCTENAEDQEEE